jgi:CheY-like chemotaxis protein
MTKILVVDDEPPVRKLLQEMLEVEGHEVIIASGGAEALRLFDGQTFDAVFTDIGMSGMDGWELARQLRARDEKLPLAVITGWGEIISDQARAAAQVDWVLTKPFSLDQIADIAAEVTQRRAQQHENSPAED